MLFPILFLASTGSGIPPEVPYPEPMPRLMESCFLYAIENELVSEEETSWKYMCGDEPAQAMWDHLATLGIEPWEQVVPEGTWLTIGFPLGGCFRRIKDPDGQPTNIGISCSIWVPRPEQLPPRSDFPG